jgi:uncharacterized damage-inducible protein DinB
MQSMKAITLIFLLLITLTINAQEMKTEQLPYYEIPEAPENYTAGTVAARMVDGLGFRYYWATEGLRAEDLNYEPGQRVRSSAQIIDHIYNLSKVIVNATTKMVNDSAVKEGELTFEEKRKRTLENFQKASKILRNSTDLSEFNVVFKNDKGTNSYPFWNNINGPIADAIWHSGQVTLLRRASGNPFNGKASVFMGKVRP